MTPRAALLCIVLPMSSLSVSAEEAAPAAVPAAAPEASVPAPAPAPVADTAMSVSVDPAVSAAVGKPEAGKALVVFFRPKAMVGAAVGFKVREGETELGKLRNGNYFTLQVEPGKHEYVVHSEARDVTTIDAEEGETYFLSGEINMGFLAGRPNLSPSSLIEFAAAFPKLKPSKPLAD